MAPKLDFDTSFLRGFLKKLPWNESMMFWNPDLFREFPWVFFPTKFLTCDGQHSAVNFVNIRDFPTSLTVLSSSQLDFFQNLLDLSSQKTINYVIYLRNCKRGFSPLNKTPLNPPFNEISHPGSRERRFPRLIWAGSTLLSTEGALNEAISSLGEEEAEKMVLIPKLGPGRRCVFFIIFAYCFVFLFFFRRKDKFAKEDWFWKLIFWCFVLMIEINNTPLDWYCIYMYIDIYNTVHAYISESYVYNPFLPPGALLQETRSFSFNH